MKVLNTTSLTSSILVFSILCLTVFAVPVRAACVINTAAPTYEDTNRDSWCSANGWNEAYKYWYTASQWISMTNENGTWQGTVTLFEDNQACDTNFKGAYQIGTPYNQSADGFLWTVQPFAIGIKQISTNLFGKVKSGGLEGCLRTQPSPIFAQFDSGSLDFTDVEHGVYFDLESSGQPLHLAWTQPNANQAWLIRGSSAIDGTNLFGNLSPQAAPLIPGEEDSGYRALRLYDLNGDMQITSDEAEAAQLHWWFDRNHDGKSSPDEVVPFASKLSSLNLNYRVSNKVDRHKNRFRFRSEGTMPDGTKVHTFDVFPKVGQ